jgi:hypothetical protein
MDYFITIEEIRENTVIDKNTDPVQLKIMLTQAHKRNLREILGIKLYDQLSLAIHNKTVTVKQRELIDGYVKDFLYSCMEMISVYTLFAKIGDSGVNMPNPQNVQNLSKEQLSSLRINKEGNVNYFGGLLKSYLEENIAFFPLYNETNTILDAKKINTWGFYIDPDIYLEDDLYYNRQAINDQEESI